ncbi:thiol reductant ABC exporter subunit CydC [Nitrincola schmidtii]|uniref:thiol reductant ABC exporter subunit CydC n=1 Tax=Nitrincola schmidtii TaxID=1730894 RepID=UPI00124EFBCA|nr:thiol reductant ABC exporter subunit CydC [Nitrincola schmidtii]
MQVLLPFIRLMKPHLSWVLLGSFLGLFTLFASIGLLTLSGWFIAATALAGISVASAQAFNYMTPGGGVRGFAIARTAGRYFERITTHEATFRLLASLRSWFYEHLEPLNPARLRQYRSADLLNRIITDINSLDNLYLRVLSPSLIAAVTTLLITLFLWWVSPSFGMLMFIALMIAGICVPWIGHQLGKSVGSEQVIRSSALRQATLTYIQGMSELHLYKALEIQQSLLEERQAAMQVLQLKMSLITGLVTALMTFAAGLTTLFALVIGISLVTEGQLAPAWLALVVFCVLASFEAVAPLPLAYQYLGKTRASAANLLEITQQQSDITFPEEMVQPLTPGSIEFNSVRFAYDERVILHDLSLHIHAGQKVALSGHTGSGKSSIINLLTRFWSYQQGQILLGGIPVEHYPEEQLRSHISVLSQPVQLFAGSVRNNLMIGNAKATDEQMLAVLHRLALTEMLGSDGLDREVGEGGNRLSGGQRKRLGIARALLKTAPILILDEPTEGLDIDTAKQVMDAVMSHQPDQTLIIITHHQQGLDRFDQHIRLDHGRRID